MEHTDGTGIEAVADARHNAADDHMRDAVGAGLESGAHGENNASGQDALAAAEFLASEEGAQGAEEASLSC